MNEPLTEARAKLKHAEERWLERFNTWLHSRGGAGEAEADRACQAASEELGRARDQYEADSPETTSDPRFYRLAHAAHSDVVEAEALVTKDRSIVDARNSIGETAFHYLVVENDLPAVRWLLEHGSDINTRNSFDATPLLEASTLGYVEMVRFLLERGADPALRDHIDETALSSAAAGRKLGVVKVLLEHLPPEANINTYFDWFSAKRVLEQRGRVAKLLEQRGLRNLDE